MPDSQLFHCPTCGAGLPIPNNDATAVRCTYCNSSVVVPPEMRRSKEERGAIPPYISPGTPPVSMTVDETIVQVANHGIRSVVIGLVITIVTCLLVSGILAATGVVSIAGLVGTFSRTGEPGERGGPPLPAVAQVTQAFATLAPALERIAATPTSDLPYRVTLTFGEKGDAAGQLEDARWLAVDRAGQIYAADYQSGRITIFDAQGQFVRALAVPPDANELITISDIAIDPTGGVAVLRTNEILFYNTAGEITRRYTVKFPAPRYFALAFDPTGRLFVLFDSASRAGLGELDANGQFLWKQELVTEALHKKTEISQVNDLAVDGSGNIYLLDNMLNRVYIFDDKGQYVDRFGGKGQEAGQLDRPEALALDGKNRLYIADGNFISIFDRQGVYLSRIPKYWQGWLSDLALDPDGGLVGISNTPAIYKVELKLK